VPSLPGQRGGGAEREDRADAGEAELFGRLIEDYSVPRGRGARYLIGNKRADSGSNVYVPRNDHGPPRLQRGGGCGANPVQDSGVRLKPRAAEGDADACPH
jgi:hypothetical protein